MVCEEAKWLLETNHGLQRAQQGSSTIHCTVPDIVLLTEPQLQVMEGGHLSMLDWTLIAHFSLVFPELLYIKTNFHSLEIANNGSSECYPRITFTVPLFVMGQWPEILLHFLITLCGKVSLHR